MTKQAIIRAKKYHSRKLTPHQIALSCVSLEATLSGRVFEDGAAQICSTAFSASARRGDS
jgi:hypothetical protein